LATVFQALLLGLYTIIGYEDALAEFAYLGTSMTVAGFITGLIMGDPMTGLIIGASCELVFLGIYAVGGARPPEPFVGTVIAAAIAIESHTGIEVALPLAVPIAVLGAQLFTVLLTASTVWIHAADKFNEKGQFGKAYLMHVLAGPVMISSGMAVPIVLAVLYGGAPIESFNNWVSANVPWLWGSLSVGAALMVPVGIAALMKMYWNIRFIPFFLIGFTLAAAIKIGIIPVVIMGGAIAAIFYTGLASDSGQVNSAPSAKMETTPALGERKLTNRDLFGAFLRHYLLQNSWCFERMQALGYYFSIMPIVRKIFPKEEATERGKMHLEFYNTNPNTSALILGINLALEEQKTEMDVIKSLKTGLMGAMAGIGDSIYGFAFRATICAIGASLALQGSIIGPILIIVGAFVVLALSKWYFIKAGYNTGLGIVELMKKGVVEKATNAIGILGSMSMGSIVATWVNITTPLKYMSQGQEVVSVQSVLDGIFPKLLPLAFLILAVTLLRKGLSLTKTMLLFFVLGVVLAIFGILG